MRVIRRDLFNLTRSDTVTIVPIFDAHLGADACDEKRLAADIARIRDDPQCYWIGGGDMCDFINRKDKRFDQMSVARWCRDETDMVGAQVKRFNQMFKPIASKCLALVRGNHEASILRHYERDVYSEIVTYIKEHGGFKDDDLLGVGTYGWLMLGMYRSKQRERGTTLYINLHHGFTTGRLQGGKALNMQRWLWSHDCDVALQGHSHNSMCQSEMVEGVSEQGIPYEKKRFGVFCGTYLRSHGDNDGTYTEEKGYLPNGDARWEIRLHPNEQDPLKRIEVAAV